jgi:hypothetical protein
MYKCTRIEIISRERETVRDREDDILKTCVTLYVCVCVFSIIYYDIIFEFLPVRLALLRSFPPCIFPRSLLSFRVMVSSFFIFLRFLHLHR